VAGFRSNEEYQLRRRPRIEANSYSSQLTLKACRTIWLSDFHLGTRGCKAAALLDFLQNHTAESLYLVGDIVDSWKAGPSWYWSAAQKGVVEEIAAWRRRGTRVEIIPGNHDDFSLLDALFGITPKCDELIHRTLEGRRMLVIHGHQFDGSLAGARLWKSGQAYSMALRINHWYSRGLDARCDRASSLSTYLKYRVKRAVEYFSDFDDRPVLEAARRCRVDGVICGHVHRAEQRLVGPIWYINDGDWVHSRTALIEDHDGALRLLRWDAAEGSAETAEAAPQSDQAEAS
jgi:UDP-2,3-diacylglucosamine pyrophosphatase LpxH